MQLSPHEYATPAAKGLYTYQALRLFEQRMEARQAACVTKAAIVHAPHNPKPPKLRKCPCCKTGQLATIAVFGQRGPPLRNNTAPTLTAC
jgi:hypothetical protein